MLNPIQIEELYRQYTENLSSWAHDGIVAVDLNLLQELNLLDQIENEKEENEDDLTQYFHVIESAEKVTLFNIAGLLIISIGVITVSKSD